MAENLGTTEDRLLLRELMRTKDGLDLYAIHVGHGLTPGQLASALSKIIEAGIAVVDGLSATLSLEGREYCFKHATQIWGETTAAPWKEVPEELRQPADSRSLLYIPSFMTRP